MDFAARCVLSGVRHGMSDVGETLATLERITDGDPGSWMDEFLALGRRLRRTADVAALGGHDHSAWNAALRAANYLFAGLWWAPATGRAEEYPALWLEHRDSWDLAVQHWPSQVWPVRLPHHDTTLPGHWFHSPVGSGEPGSALVLIGGLGAPISDACMTGLDGALARGHHVLVVEGPGQGAALHRQGLLLDRSWSGLVTSALDWLATRPEVDEDRVVVLGTEHGALAAAWGAAADHRVAALVVDPGVVDLGADARAAVDAAQGERGRRLLAATTTMPTGARTLDEAVAVLDAYRIDAETIAEIASPTFVAGAESGGSFCGQGDRFAGALRTEHVHHVFSEDDGAGADCGLDASQLHDAVVFDWIDDVLARTTAHEEATHG